MCIRYIFTRAIVGALLGTLIIGCQTDSPTKSSEKSIPETTLKIKVDSTSTYLYKISQYEDDTLQDVKYQYFQLKDNEPNTLYFKGTELEEGGNPEERKTLSDNSFYKTMDTLDVNSLRIIQNEILYGSSPFLVQYKSKFAKLNTVKQDSISINSIDYDSQLITYTSKSDSSIVIREWVGPSYILKRKVQETIDGSKLMFVTEYFGNKTQAKSLNLID